MKILGLHHITLVCRDAQRTVNFYAGVLGLRLVKQTVNFDNPKRYHLYFGDRTGRPGSAVTFFEWPQAASGSPGIGGSHHFALQTRSRDTLRMWKRRLTDLGLKVTGPLDRQYFESIYFRDPDGAILEIATIGPGFTVDEAPEALGTEHCAPPAALTVRNREEARIREDTWPEPVTGISNEMALEMGMHHITAIGSNIARIDEFYSGLLGLQRVKMTANFDDPGSAHWYWGVDHGRPGSLVTYFERDPKTEPQARLGAGQTHHFALSAAGEDELPEWREKLIRAGLQVSPVKDRLYFKSIYTSDPDGQIIELATPGPGFLIDEPEAELGRSVSLPPWLENQRAALTAALRPILPADPETAP